MGVYLFLANVMFYFLAFTHQTDISLKAVKDVLANTADKANAFPGSALEWKHDIPACDECESPEIHCFGLESNCKCFVLQI